ncbi:Disease resistance protein [Quillaja saponaria]|uniref:Disease resistance protein n=1 Tax=Quillaja saponaria TaxID=32244 RepID=A0AAD7M242_QUISA|nr:Disease resistance protein [Quillaja saponaria]
MALTAVEKLKQEVLDWIKRDQVSIIVLVGEAGVGKTWITRCISDLVEREGLSYQTLWMSFLYEEECDLPSFLESIAHQLFILSNECEEEIEDEKKEKEQPLKTLEEKISDRLDEMMSKIPEKQFILLILDGVPEKKKGEEILSKFKFLQRLMDKRLLKVLMSTRNDEDGSETEPKEFKMIRLADRELQRLLEEGVGENVSNFDEFKTQLENIARKSESLPAAITVIGGALKHIGQHDSEDWTLETAVIDAASDMIPLIRCGYDMLPSNDMALINCCLHSLNFFFFKHGGIHYNQLIICWIMEGYFDHIDRIEEAYEEGHRVLMELITRGMLKMQEDNVVIMEKLAAAVSAVVVEGSALTTPNRHRDGFRGIPSLGLASVFKNTDWRVLGRIRTGDGMIKTPSGPERIRTDGMIKILSSPERWEKVSTLLVDGSRLRRDLDTFFQAMRGLQFLAIFNPSFQSPPKSLSKMNDLHLLVLRGCSWLQNTAQISKLKSLITLEISGATFLEEVPDDLFREMCHLLSLNLSGTHIKLLPSSFCNLTKLRWLILRNCSCLELLPTVIEMKDLEVIDLSGATSLKTIHDKKLQSLPNLRILDFSHTKIASFPFLHNLEALTRVSLNGCTSLPTLPAPRSTLPAPRSSPSIQILDVSGASSLIEIRKGSLESLKILDFSKTKVKKLSFTIPNLSSLHMRGCSELKTLPSIKLARDLELLDASDACNLAEIEDKSFEHLKHLCQLDLSNTKIKILPSISNLANLRRLLLNGCKLEKLPKLEGLTRLEVLNLSGNSGLVKIEDESFEHLRFLRHLDVSNTKVKILPCLSNLGNLRFLYLRECKFLEKLPKMGGLTKLEVLVLSGCCTLAILETESFKNMSSLRTLDLSGTNIECLPSESLPKLEELNLSGATSFGEIGDKFFDCMNNFLVLNLSKTKVRELPSLTNLSSLRQLLLRDCDYLEKLPALDDLKGLEVLDLSGTKIKEFHYAVSMFTRLISLNLPDLEGVQLPEDLNWDECGILMCAVADKISEETFVCGSGIAFLQFLKKNPKLWEKYLERFCISIFSHEKNSKNRDIYLHREEPIFRDIYFQTISFPEKCVRYIEICGFDSFPAEKDIRPIGEILKQAEYFALTENAFIQRLEDVGQGNVEAMKGCWLKSCPEIKHIFVKEKADVKFAMTAGDPRGI